MGLSAEEIVAQSQGSFRRAAELLSQEQLSQSEIVKVFTQIGKSGGRHVYAVPGPQGSVYLVGTGQAANRPIYQITAQNELLFGTGRVSPQHLRR